MIRVTRAIQETLRDFMQREYEQRGISAREIEDAFDQALYSSSVREEIEIAIACILEDYSHEH